LKKLVSLAVSLLLLALIYWKIDFARLGPVFARSHPGWMTASLLMVVPLTMLTAWRFQRLVPTEGRISFGEANRLILSASVLNLVLPSKMGDIAKAFFMPGLRRSLALSLVVFEKACDMLSLLLWCVFGLIWVRFVDDGTAMRAFDPNAWFAQLQMANPLPAWANGTLIYALCFLIVAGSLFLGILLLGSRTFARFFFGLGQRFAPGKWKAKFEKLSVSWGEMHGYFWASKRRLATVTLGSVFIWLLHLLQIWLFIFALRAACPFWANLALSPLAILAGLAPLTFAGVGTRDFALVLLYSAYFDAPTAAALGLLCTARYVLPAIGGVPFFHRYLAALRATPSQA
jgi:glycosyltransferase 2 family protein